MEKILTPEERIRRAEEIYYRRKNNINNTKSTVVNVSRKKDFGMFKKMILQIIICILIYTIYYMIQNTNYIFSESVINKTKEILAYDINIKNIYQQINGYISGFIKREEKVEQKTANETNINADETNLNTNVDLTNSNTNNLETNNIGGEKTSSEIEENLNLTQMEKDAKEILESKKLSIPLKGTITSRYGLRNPKDPSVPKNHTGIDIAANEGTIFNAAMAGIVKEVSNKGDLGNHITIVDKDISTVYAHCKTIYLKEGENVKQGQKVGEVGNTGNSTGPHLHFEIKKQNRYVNPDLVLKFE